MDSSFLNSASAGCWIHHLGRIAQERFQQQCDIGLGRRTQRVQLNRRIPAFEQAPWRLPVGPTPQDRTQVGIAQAERFIRTHLKPNQVSMPTDQPAQIFGQLAFDPSFRRPNRIEPAGLHLVVTFDQFTPPPPTLPCTNW